MKAWLPSIVGLCLYVAACGESGGNDDDRHDSDHGDAADFEGCPDTIPQFSLGMSTQTEDGSLKLAVQEASPSPPARFFNDWTVKLAGADDAPRSDVTLQRVRAYMPVHNHYGLPDPRITQHPDEPGVFDVDRLNLFMRGPWQILLEVNSSDGAAQLSFEVCVEE